MAKKKKTKKAAKAKATKKSAQKATKKVAKKVAKKATKKAAKPAKKATKKAAAKKPAPKKAKAEKHKIAPMDNDPYKAPAASKHEEEHEGDFEPMPHHGAGSENVEEQFEETEADNFDEELD